MSQSIPRTRTGLAPLLEARGLRLSKRLGQNFLVDPNLADALVADAGVRPGDRVIEIGPGAGALTQPLLAAGARVTAVEIDRGLHELLAEHLGNHPDLELVHGDCLAGDGSDRAGLHPAIRKALTSPPSPGIGDGTTTPDRVLVVANLPYCAGTPAVLRLLVHDPPPTTILAMLQAEVADRLRAKTGSRDYGPAAVLVAVTSTVEVVRKVPAAVFLPRPKVESAVVRITPDPARRSRVGDLSRLVDIVGTAFRQRRKRIAKGLSGIVDPEHLSRAGIDPDARPATVPPDAWVRLVHGVSPGDTA